MTISIHPIIARVFKQSLRTLLLPVLTASLVFLGVSPAAIFAGIPRALGPGTQPNDARLHPLKDYDGYFPFEVSRTPAEWAKRAAPVRRQILVALGLSPLPTKGALQAVIHGKIDRPDYTVEKVYFESVAGFYVTGNLYRPKGKTGKLPGVLCPHGHWDQGRFHDSGLENVRKEIVQGAERFEEGGRSPLQARCVQLARMGCVVFHYDMIGYADSQQISYELAHRFKDQRPEMNTVENWGLFSPQAEAHLQSVMGLQTWNSIRALDFLLGLPEVDSERIGVTGASGGGTQTFILSAIDPRVTVAFPAVMVSTAMQGGCTCENACLLRVETGNIEFAALFAPKPLGMTAANDWTKEMERKGFPELKQHYRMLGAPEHVMLKPLIHFDHNYNYVSRGALYSWFNKHLNLGLQDPIVEEDYRRLSKQEMSVWDDQHPKPEGGPEFERKLLRQLTEDADRKLQAARSSMESFREIVGENIDSIIGRSFSQVGEGEWDLKQKTDRGHYLEMTGLLRNKSYAEELPIVFLHPKEWKGQSIIWIHEAGKAGLYHADGSLTAPIQTLLKGGATVVGVDLLHQGEFLPDGRPMTKTERVKNPREFAGFTFGYNHTLFAHRVHDILTVVHYMKNHERKSETITLVGLGGAGPLVAAARAQARDAVDLAVIDTGGFRFGKLLNIHDVNFLPGGAKYGDLPGMLALGAPGKLWLAGEGKEAPELVQTIYKKSGAEKKLTVFSGQRDAIPSAAAAGLLDKN